MAATVVWFRLDLRVEDNPALHAAVRRGAPVVPLFIWAPEDEGAWAPGSASRYWLNQSLASLSTSVKELGSRLILRTAGTAKDALDAVIAETKADAVYWNRRYEPARIARDSAIKTALTKRGIAVESFNSALLFEPWEIRNKQGGPFQVFTPFWKACLKASAHPEPIATPTRLPAPSRWPRSEALERFELEPRVDWAAGIREKWRAGEAGAHQQLDRFLNDIAAYREDRDRPDRVGTSRLSPHLHFGEIGPRQVWHAVREHGATATARGVARGEETYLEEVGWREFAHHLLFHFPHTTDNPLREKFARFPWANNRAHLRAWQKGQTGYPIVDAGMRELWRTGWMHNRVRMIVASFLTKDLLIPWHEGAKWFWDTLVDADLASNTLGWQWTAGCGADAAPYFRIFNPTSQGMKFDPNGDYVRQWTPELAKLDAKWIHNPNGAPSDVLRKADVSLGTTYPKPIIDHGEARARALEAFAAIRA
ncbi:MAG: deoxyribodipyrimidine photo-lyase [Candidatus Hydrogenedentes bacterium]|nr:deoxyribodipyrimidine photo-lyase [Candidatus Hydrogenedentota bacterium]